ncbi:hypothetical protein BD311DRAFT_803784 [Dichomitus squalens]|uniref:DUF6533 domain-containing protein n=1 Tax=Dichomitus squalens TaxID=114155 RepID=A0A4Q9MX75_9APHY|nr:hypothetical protein BD311DRAFT_803784 [Dichomitus squalens]
MADIVAGLLQQFWELRVSVYANVASLALLVYDWQLTFGDEVNTMWMSKAKFSKLLFLWIRYFGIGTHTFIVGAMYLLPDPSPSTWFELLHDPSCRVATTFQIAGPNIMWWSVEFVFALRVWILYERSRKLLLFLAMVYTVSIGVSAVLLVKALLHVDLITVPGGVVSGCFASVPNYIYGAFVIGNITTSMLCVLTLYQTIRFRDGITRSPLITLFLRDGLVYYFVVSVVFLLNLFMFRFGAATFKILFSGFLEAIPCMFGARVLINILSLVQKQSGVSDTAPPYSEPKFRHTSTAGFDSGAGVTSSGTDAGTSTSGTVTVDSGCGTGTHLSARSSSSGMTLSRGALSACAMGLEEVPRTDSDDIEKGYDS